jgi:hypothetical protein
MPQVIALFVAVLGILALGDQRAEAPHTFNTVVPLETTSADSANVSMGDLDGDGDLDLVLAKGRHTPLLDRVLLNDGRGAFVASDLGPTADRTYTAALADVDGDGDLDVLTSNDGGLEAGFRVADKAKTPYAIADAFAEALAPCLPASWLLSCCPLVPTRRFRQPASSRQWASRWPTPSCCLR